MRSTTSNVSLRQDTYRSQRGMLDGQIGHRVADDESVAGRRLGQAHEARHAHLQGESQGVRELATFTPGALERTFEGAACRPEDRQNPSAGVLLAGHGGVRRHGFEIAGPQLA